MTAAPTLFRARSVITMEPDTAPGKLANFTVLAQDPYTVAPEQLNRIDVLEAFTQAAGSQRSASCT
ncbi:MAG: hypothetical protein ACXWEI_15310 [Mycobacterium sp.]